MLTKEDNELLCRVEGDAPMGQVMRRHWQPACLTEEVAEPDGRPCAPEMLGEDLVVFRDYQGPGRRAGRALPAPRRLARLRAQRGMRPALPLSRLEIRRRGQRHRDGLRARRRPAEQERKQKAYPARERGGFVWAYMGLPRRVPRVRAAGMGAAPDTRISIVKMHRACNWAQVLEGSIDSAHSSSLHSSDMPSMDVDGAKATGDNWLRPSTDKAPRMQVERRATASATPPSAKPIRECRDTRLRPHHGVRRAVHRAHPAEQPVQHGADAVPDRRRRTPCSTGSPGTRRKGIPQDDWRKFCAGRVGVDLDRDYRKIRTLENNFLQDREAMKAGDFTGIKGIPAQDMAMWETMGPIADRSETISARATSRSSSSAGRWSRPPSASATAAPPSARRSRASRRRSSRRSKASCRNRPIGARSASRPKSSPSRAGRTRRRRGQRAWRVGPALRLSCAAVEKDSG